MDTDEDGEDANLCLLAEGFPPSFYAKGVAESVQDLTEVRIHKVAPIREISQTGGNMKTKWLLLFHTLQDKEMCKQQNLTLVDGGDDFHIRLRRPPANAVSSADDWILVEQSEEMQTNNLLAETFPPKLKKQRGRQTRRNSATSSLQRQDLKLPPMRGGPGFLPSGGQTGACRSSIEGTEAWGQRTQRQEAKVLTGDEERHLPIEGSSHQYNGIGGKPESPEKMHSPAESREMPRFSKTTPLVSSQQQLRKNGQPQLQQDPQEQEQPQLQQQELQEHGQPQLQQQTPQEQKRPELQQQDQQEREQPQLQQQNVQEQPQHQDLIQPQLGQRQIDQHQNEQAQRKLGQTGQQQTQQTQQQSGQPHKQLGDAGQIGQTQEGIGQVAQQQVGQMTPQQTGHPQQQFEPTGQRQIEQTQKQNGQPQQTRQPHQQLGQMTPPQTGQPQQQLGQMAPPQTGQPQQQTGQMVPQQTGQPQQQAGQIALQQTGQPQQQAGQMAPQQTGQPQQQLEQTRQPQQQLGQMASHAQQIEQPQQLLGQMVPQQTVHPQQLGPVTPQQTELPQQHPMPIVHQQFGQSQQPQGQPQQQLGQTEQPHFGQTQQQVGPIGQPQIGPPQFVQLQQMRQSHQLMGPTQLVQQQPVGQLQNQFGQLQEQFLSHQLYGQTWQQTAQQQQQVRQPQQHMEQLPQPQTGEPQHFGQQQMEQVQPYIQQQQGTRQSLQQPQGYPQPQMQHYGQTQEHFGQQQHQLMQPQHQFGDFQYQPAQPLYYMRQPQAGMGPLQPQPQLVEQYAQQPIGPQNQMMTQYQPPGQVPHATQQMPLGQGQMPPGRHTPGQLTSAQTQEFSISIKGEKFPEFGRSHSQTEIHGQPIPIAREPTEEECTSTVEVDITRQPHHDNDFYRRYFENNQNGGGDVMDIIARSDGVLLVTFADPEVAKRVAARQHCIAGHEVTVALNKPLQIYTNRLLFRNVPRGVSSDLLVKRLKQITGQEADEILYGDEFTVIIATFDEKPDFDKTQQMCKKKRLEGKELSVSRVPVSNGILVEGLDDNITEDTVETYFESRRSRGGPVNNVDMNPEEGRCYVYFEDSSAASRVVAKKKHVINGKQVQVKLYFDCLGADGGTDKPLDSVQTAGTTKAELHTATVEVTVAELQPKDIYKRFFEDPSNGGGEVKDIQFTKDDTVLVTFAEAAVAEDVSKREHSIDGQPVYVKLYQVPKPRPNYPNKLKFSNVPTQVAHETLVSYLESAAKVEVEGILYGDDSSVVVATFKKEPDMKALLQHCSKKLLDKRKLKVERLQMSSCVLVEDLIHNVTEETVSNHFESTKRSGGGPVERVEMDLEERRCYVHFEDHEVIENVLGKSHMINGKKVQVKLYFRCLGPSGGTDRNFECPEPLTLKMTDDECKCLKFQFLRDSVKVKEGFVNLLSVEHARPRFTDDSLIVECTLTADDVKSRAKSRTWKVDVETVVDSNLKLLKVDTRQVPEEMWNDVLKGLTGISSDCDRAVLEKIPEKRILRAVGMETDVDQIIRSIDEVISKCDHKLNLETQKITKTKKLKPSKLFLLDASAFFKNVKSNDESLSVTIDTQTHLVTFHGLKEDVIQVQRDMYELLDSRKSCAMPNMSESKRKVLSSLETRRELAGKFRKARIVASWETTDDGVEVYGFKDKDIQNAVQVMQDSVVEKVCPEVLEILQTPEGMNMQNRWLNKYPGVLAFGVTPGGQFCITCLDHILSSVTSAVKTFVDENSIHVEVLFCSPSRQKVVCSLLDERQRDALAEEFKVFRVLIELIDEETKIQVSGTQMGLQQVRGKLEALERQVIVHEETVQEQAKVKFLNKRKYKGEVDDVSRIHHCVLGREREPAGVQILVQSGTSSRPPGHPFQGDPDVTVGPSNVQSAGGVSVLALRADITELTVDVIVNTANERMDHAGGLAKVIVDKGGKSIQDECHRQLKKMKGGRVPTGGVLLSGPGSLPCRAIIHTVGPRYGGGGKGEDDSLRQTVTNCLQTADAQNFVSIAIPTISSGIFGYPAAEAARVIVQAVKNYVDAHPDGSVKFVVLCDVLRDTVKHLNNALKEFFPQQNKTGTVEKTSLSDSRLKVSIVQGEIANHSADVLVNSTATNLALKKGDVSASMLAKGDQGLQDECQKKYPRGIKVGEVAETAGHGLGCHVVYHLAMCQWSDPQATQILDQLVTRCLSMASQSGFSSIAFPALGTGQLGYPRDTVAQTMLTAIDTFERSNPSTSLREVWVVVYQKDQQTFQDFCRVEGQLKGRGSAQGDQTAVAAPPAAPSPVSTIAPTSSIKTCLEEGEIAQQKADVLVNTSVTDLDLKNGAVSAAMLAKGGQGLQDECKKKYPQGIKVGEVAETAGHGLGCRVVYHLALCQWSDPQATQILDRLVTRCLSMASQSGFTSIAFPALGTGQLGYPRDTVAQTMLTAIDTFERSNPSTSLREVRIVLYQKDQQTIQEFRQVERLFKGGSAHGNQAAVGIPSSDAPVTTAVVSDPDVTKALIVEGEIANHQADVLVNSTATNLDLNKGAVSASMLAKGGQGLQDECKNKYPQGIKVGEVAETAGHGLGCRVVYHLALCQWSDPQATQILYELVTGCLSMANQSGFSSIAFPALGTGQLGYPRDTVAQIMLTAIDTFGMKNPSTSLREIRIVLYQKDQQTIQAFQRVYGQQQNAGSVQEEQSGTRRQRRRFSDSTEFVPPPAVQPDAECQIMGLNVIIRQGDVTEEHADAIINIINGNQDQERAFAALKTKAGPSLDADLQKKAPELNKEGVAVTKAAKIHCKFIIHMDARKHSPTWEAGIKLCLKKASGKNRNIKTLAMPALCRDTDDLAKVVFKAVTQYRSNKGKEKGLEELRLLLPQGSLLQAFVQSLQTLGEKENQSEQEQGERLFSRFKTALKGRKVGQKQPFKMLVNKCQGPVQNVLYIYASEQKKIDDFLKAFDKRVKDKFVVREVEIKTLQRMKPEQKQKIEHAAVRYDVDLNMDYAKETVELTGFHEDVLEAEVEINKIAHEAEVEEHEAEKEAIYADMVQWYFLEVTTDGMQRMEYHPKPNRILEKAYQNEEKKAEFVDNDGYVYIVDFDSMTETPDDDKEDTVGVIRREKIKDMDSQVVHTPDFWDRNPSGDHVLLISLKDKDPEYKNVEKTFNATIGNTAVKVTAVKRIQNETLYRQYAVRKSDMQKQNPGIENEKTLWHGTSAEATEKINYYGFNRSYCGKNAVVFGQGVYFAVSSSYSANPTYSPGDTSEDRFMYLCKVLVGHATTGNRAMRVLPERAPPLLFDSATDDPANPTMYIIFNDTQAYPEYLITFR